MIIIATAITTVAVGAFAALGILKARQAHEIFFFHEQED